MAANNPSTVRTYCSLFIGCNGELERAIEELEKYGLRFDEYVDNQSPERRELFKRLQSRGVGRQAKPLRHNWHISSQGRVKKMLLEPHFLWVFKQIKPGKRLAALKKKGFLIRAVCFWETSDFGGGPAITDAVSRLLQYHQLELQIDTYPASSPS